MMRSFILVLFILIFSLTACGQEEVLTTPTPFDTDRTAVALVSSGQPTAVSLAALAADPESFAGQFLQLSGDYQHLPLLVCNGEMHQSPAGWLLVDNSQTELSTDEQIESEIVMVAAGGFDSQLRSLIATGAPLTVNGFWRFWEGPVGCGKQAVPRQIWYLRVTQIVSPAQLARVTVIGSTRPAGEETAVPTEDGGVAGEEGTTPITPTLPITATPTLPDMGTLPGVTPTTTNGTLPAVEATPTDEGIKDDEETPTADFTPTPNGSGESDLTPTLTNTPPPGASLTPTPAGGTTEPGTPTATSQPGTYTVVEVDPINPDASMYGLETLGAWQKQNWPITLISSQAITIGVAAEPTMNVAIAVYDDSDNLLMTQDNAPAGQLEEIRNLRVDPTQTYIIQVYETNGRGGAYFMTIVGDQAGLVLYSRGILSSGLTRQDRLAADHRHFWYFYGQAGDVVDITTTTDPDKLILISFYDMNADLLTDDNGDELEYVEEEILDFTLPETGLYLIWLEEFAYEPASYSITIIAN
ncbi:MAG TPA: hypothetical protein PLD25_28455 [Chloroflexota bacterium]|nr:hypothetical protein [Chloroflexota bacterium]HUM68557.1 hypothetical protein [Chloroflexota bacterium]